jgi:hypothetical protein
MLFVYQEWSMDMAKINSQEGTEWFNQILVDSGVFRPDTSIKGIWIGLDGE